MNVLSKYKITTEVQKTNACRQKTLTLNSFQCHWQHMNLRDKMRAKLQRESLNTVNRIVYFIHDFHTKFYILHCSYPEVKQGQYKTVANLK